MNFLSPENIGKRFFDPASSVRCEALRAVTSICEVALDFIPTKLMEELGGRLLDKDVRFIQRTIIKQKTFREISSREKLSNENGNDCGVVDGRLIFFRCRSITSGTSR